MIVIVSSGSRESRNKANEFLKASEKLQLNSLHINSNTFEGLNQISSATMVVSTSDSTNKLASEICNKFGLDYYSGLGEHSKSGSYHCLKRAGFQTLWFSELRSNEHLRSLIGAYEGKVFVKPEHGSCAWDSSRFGYKTYDSLSSFYDHLVANNISLVEGQYMVMEYVSMSEMYCMSALLRPNSTFCFSTSMLMLSPSLGDYTGLLLADIDICKKQIEPHFYNLWASGFRSPIIYLQCALKNGVLYPIDANTRMSTLLDTYCTHANNSFYENMLSYWILNEECRAPNILFPTVVGRILTNDPFKNWNCVEGVNDKNVYWANLNGFTQEQRATAGFDTAYSRPTYIIQDATVSKVLSRHCAIQHTARVK